MFSCVRFVLSLFLSEKQSLTKDKEQSQPLTAKIREGFS